jgi:signal transduction histidine kinase/ActR/RegA family two-component response regulator
MSKSASSLLRYSSAVASIALATLIWLPLQVALKADRPFTPFYAAVILTAWYGGFGPALLAVVLGTLSAACFFLPPENSLAITRTTDWIGLGLYSFVGLASALFSESQRGAQRRAEASAQDALQKQRELEREIEERQRAEEGLRCVTAGVQCILWHADVVEREDGQLSWELKVLDEAAARRFLPVALLDGCGFVPSWYESRLPEDKARMDAYAQREVRASRSYHQEFRCRMASGAIRWLSEDVQIRAEAPGRWHAVGVCTDVTERKHLEAELQDRAEALAEADRRKDDFMALLGHELRNPLGAINNAVQVLLRGSVDQAAGQRALEVLHRQVAHQARLVDDLLDVARINRGKVFLEREWLDLRWAVRHTLEDHRGALEATGLSLRLELPEEPVWFAGDRIRLAQVLGNLLTNAAKFTDAGGQVTVRLTTEADGSRAAVTVRDSGIGIEPKLLPRLFESFTQADPGLARSQGGLGLGLALVRGLVELHGGHVRAASDGLGHGAAFTFTLPLAGNEAPCRQEPTPPPPRVLPRRILVVEDNRDAAETLRDLLQMAGHEVTLAFTGPAGVDAARRLRPEVVLCDIGLPGLDGYAVARAVRQDAATAAAYLIALSGYGQEEDRRRSREAGFHQHLIKPINYGELEALLISFPPAKQGAAP